MVATKKRNVKLQPLHLRQVKAALALKGLTQQDLAEQIGASRVAVNRSLTHGLNRGVLRRILTLLDIQNP